MMQNVWLAFPDIVIGLVLLWAELALIVTLWRRPQLFNRRATLFALFILAAALMHVIDGFAPGGRTSFVSHLITAIFAVCAVSLVLPFAATVILYFSRLSKPAATVSSGKIFDRVFSFHRFLTSLEDELQDRIEAENNVRQKTEALALMETLFRSVPIGFAFVDRQLLNFRANDTAYQILGLSGENGGLSGQVLSETQPDLTRQFDPYFHRVLQTRKPLLDLEIKSHDTNGDERFWLLNFYPVFDQQGELLGVGSLAIDVTDRERTAAALRQSEKRLAAMIQNLPGIGYLKDAQGHFIYVSNLLDKILRENGKLWRGKTNEQLFGAELGAEFSRSEMQVLESGSAVQDIVSMNYPGESLRHYLLTRFSVPESDQCALLGGVGIDITKSQEADELLRESEERLRLLLENIRDHAIVMLDPKGQILSWNSGAEAVFGYTEGEAVGMNISTLYTHDDVLRNRPQRELELATKSGIAKGECWQMRKDGAVFWCSGVTSPLWDHARNLRGFSRILRDDTERKNFEEQLKKAKDFADTANAAKSNFLAYMSHELRTPLGAITGYAEILLDPSSTSEDTSRSAEAIKRNGTQLRRLIDDILDLSKVESGKLQIENIGFSLEDLLHDVLSSTSPRAKEKGIALTISSDGLIPKNIVADPTRLRQILLNLISNAIKFTEKGSVQVMVRFASHVPCSHLLSFEVVDTGAGIPLEQQKNLFQAFSQADLTIARKFGGTGLGLALARRLAIAMGGNVELVNSTPGGGSTFMICIAPELPPAVSMTELNSQSRFASDRKSIHDERANEKLRLDDVKILLVEDGPDNQVLYQHFLDLAGADVALASDGVEGIQKVQSAEFDIILMDIQMPVLDGYQAASRLRESGYAKPIIALTAHAMKGERERCLNAGCTDYLTKPVSRAVLLAKISQHVQAWEPPFGLNVIGGSANQHEPERPEAY